MAGLLNIALATETVAGATIKGVSAKGVSYLLARFPEVRKLMSGQALSLTPEAIMMLAPEAIAAIIATGCGIVPDGSDDGAKRQREAEMEASDIPAELQLDLIGAILRVTMPGGVGPFVAKLEKLGAFAAEGFSKVADTKSPPPLSSVAPQGSEAPNIAGT